MGVASSGVTFFRSLGGTIGVSVMGAALGAPASPNSSATARSASAPRSRASATRAPTSPPAAVGTIPEVRAPARAACASIFEDIYAQAISHSFLIAVPFAVISLIAILFLPNVPLTRMTTSERAHADAAKTGSPVDDAADVAIADATALSGATTGTVTVVTGSNDGRGDAASDDRR